MNKQVDDREYVVYDHILAGELFYVGMGSRHRAYMTDPDKRPRLWADHVGDRRSEVVVRIVARTKREIAARTFEANRIMEREPVANSQYGGRRNLALSMNGFGGGHAGKLWDDPPD